MNTSILTVLAASLALAAPAIAQDVTVSTGLSAETSADANAAANAATSAAADAAANVEIDASLDVDITAEQSTNIRRIVADAKVEPAQVDFDVSLGTAIPASVTLSPLPQSIVDLNAGLDGYLFFTLDDSRIVVVSPTTLKVVLIISA
jgi:hypothetical protein